jgi:hypothetical protein
MSTYSDVNKIAIVTCSYGPDFQRCERLCHSIDRWVDTAIKHILIVPHRDLVKFSVLKSERRIVKSVQSVVPGSYRQIPGLKKWWLDPQGWPVRGWIMQQVTKLSANYATDAENIIFADSDIQFIRPLSLASILVENKLRLHRIPGAKDTGEHLAWHKRAAKLLGIEQVYAGSDYIGQLITWRRSQLEQLHQRIEQTTKQAWYRSVGRSLKISEYILYGMFVDRVQGQQSNGHFYTDKDLCHCCWSAEETEALKTESASINLAAVAILIQSNLGFSSSEEAALIQIAERKISCEPSVK